MNIFADRLKEIRKKNKISQGTLSDMLNISQNQISKYEKGTDTPSGKILWKMTQVLNVSAEFLLGMINHVDLEGLYQYMAVRRNELFKSPEGDLKFKYYLQGEQHTSVFHYIFTVFSEPEHVMTGWENYEFPPIIASEFQLILYLEEIQGNFLLMMLEENNEFAFGTLDSFLNENLALGSCYDTEQGTQQVELITKRIQEIPKGGIALGSKKYVSLHSQRGGKPGEYSVDIIKGAFLDFYLSLSIENKVTYLNRVDKV